MLEKLESPDAAVRAAALYGVDSEAIPERMLFKLLEDSDAHVRLAAVNAAESPARRSAIPFLLKLARDPDAAVRSESLNALWSMVREPRVLPLAIAALGDPETQEAAIHCVAEFGGPDQASALIESARRNPSPEALLGRDQGFQSGDRACPHERSRLRRPRHRLRSPWRAR